MDILETTDVVIVGCGPTGAMLSTLLGRYDVKNIVLEREPDITTDPRGIALDEDGIRCLQACGLYDKVFSEIGQCTGSLNFVSGRQKDLYKKEFLRFNYTTTEGGTGHPGFMFHKQPAIEKNLRQCITDLEASELRVNCTVQDISEDERWVFVTYKDSDGHIHRLQTRFLVGCDGKTGFTRKRYLEPRGIRLERAHQTSYEEIWVALNWKISLPTPETHPSFPLWEKGYSPQQVYDTFFPKDFRFLCHPSRPAVCGRFGMPDDRLWRFEFVVSKNEDGLEMAKDENIEKIVWPYLTHPARRFGIQGDCIAFPKDCVNSLRCRPFTFSARSCNKWSLGRVILCGDAAHVFPPFGGQGIASGFRDAIGLAWRLKIATTRSTDATDRKFDRLLLGWYSERKQSLDRSLASTIENGDYVTNSNVLAATARDWWLWLLQLIPSWRHWLELGDRRVGMTKYKWEDEKEMCFMPNLGGGSNIPQIYCKTLHHDKSNTRICFSDDIIFSESKQGLFQLLVLPRSVQEIRDAQRSLASVSKQFTVPSLVRIDEATYILQQTSSPPEQCPDISVFRLATAFEFEYESPLCKGRPRPVGYNPMRMMHEVGESRFVLLRPDRFVFACAKDLKELVQAMHHLGEWYQSVDFHESASPKAMCSRL